MILGTELLTPEPGLWEMWGLVPGKVVYDIARMNIGSGGDALLWADSSV